MRPAALVILAACTAEETAPFDVDPVPFEEAIDGATSSDPVVAPRAPLTLVVDPLIAGQTADLEIGGLAAGETAYLAYSLYGTGNGICPPAMGGVCLNLLSPVQQLGTAVADARGLATFRARVPANAPVGLQVSLQAVAVRGVGGNQTVKSPPVTEPVQAPQVGSPPTVTSLAVAPRYDTSVVELVLGDVDGDLAGGTLELSDGTNVWALAIPGDLDVWNPGGVSSVTLPAAPSRFRCGVDLVEDWTAEATDTAGNTSAVALGQAVVPSFGVLGDTGNRWPDDAHTEWRGMDPPLHACVQFEDDPTNGLPANDDLGNEVEGLFLQLAAAGDYRMTTWWSANADFDALVYPMSNAWQPVDRNGDGLADMTGGCKPANYVGSTNVTARNQGPEGCVFAATAGARVLVEPTFFATLLQQPAPPYTVSVLVTPE